MSEHIYLDHNATTPVDPNVTQAMLPYLGETYGNASSVHTFGRDAKVALETSRETIANFINCDPAELVFTSGGTESDNMAVIGSAYHLRQRKNHLVVGAAEHHAVIEPAEYLHHKEDFELSLLAVNSEGFSSADELRRLVTDKTALVSVMHANNENGAIQDIAGMAEAAHEKSALFHTDAVQSIGKIPVDVRAMGVDLLSLTGHKIYGPKGTGALFIRSGVKIAPLFYGGSHERRRRPGTENVAGAVGLATALDITSRRMANDFKHMTMLSDYFLDKVLSTIPNSSLNGARKNRIPQTMNISFVGLEGEPIILSLDMEGVAVSSGSACTSGATEASHVLTAMGITKAVAHGAVRFSMGRATTQGNLDYVLNILPGIVQRLRELSPSYNHAV
ncbi:MAG: cysteine desulfurase family protein [candidate division Zixibacteria bacterium]|nr:cysteine desulfurase family protein [candidate division Zixibacteria bacterium]